MSIQPTLAPSMPLETKLEAQGSVTFPVASQQLLNKVAQHQTDCKTMSQKIFTLRYSTGELRNYKIWVDNTGEATWDIANYLSHKSDWFMSRNDQTMEVIDQYLDAVQPMIAASRKVKQ